MPEQPPTYEACDAAVLVDPTGPRPHYQMCGNDAVVSYLQIRSGDHWLVRTWLCEAHALLIDLERGGI